MKRKQIFKLLTFLYIYMFCFLSDAVALGNRYYVSTTGDDNNPGTIDAPFKTFLKADTVLQEGDKLEILGGTYYEKLKITSSGTQNSPISILKGDSQPVVIDLRNEDDKNIYITGSYVNVEGKGIKVKNSNDICVDINGNYNKVQGLIVHDCQDHGIYTDGQHNIIDGNEVYLANLNNEARNTSSGWGSAIKVRVGGDDIIIQNNKIYNNYGEGIAATRGKNIIIKNNVVYDNYSVNIYIDNSYDVLAEKNFVYCTPDSGFEKDGHPATGIALAEEYYDGWGAQLSRVNVQNNIVTSCNKLIVYYGSDVAGGGLQDITITYNTLWASIDTALSIAHEAYKTQNTIIANNIVQQEAGKVAWIENRSGIDMFNNFWVGNQPDSWRNADGINDLYGDIKLPNIPDYTPQSYRLNAESPAVGAAQNISNITDDFEGKLRFFANDSMSDIGAIEYEKHGTSNCTADINKDSTVNVDDFLAVLADWGKIGNSTDIDKNGKVNISDLLKVLQSWGNCDPMSYIWKIQITSHAPHWVHGEYTRQQKTKNLAGKVAGI